MTYTSTSPNSMPIPADPAVLCVNVVTGTATVDVPVYVPWENCRLAYAYGILTGAALTTAQSCDVDLELNAAGGTEQMSMNFAAGSAIGTVAEASVSDAAACKNLDRDDADRDAVNIEAVSGAANEVMVFMYFEPEIGQ